jgi:type IV pilus assembly protein PilX
MRNRYSIHARGRQRGAVLIVSLMFLVILTILGITAMTGTTLEHKMASNTRDYAIAMQAAESALRDAHRDVNPRPNELGRNKPVSSYGTDAVAGSCGTGDFKGLCLAGAKTESASGNNIMPANISAANVTWAEYGDYTGARKLTGKGDALLTKQPLYHVEAVCQLESANESVGVASISGCAFRRITAKGFGINPNTVVTLQEVYVIAVF